jgi:hypothetical protein
MALLTPPTHDVLAAIHAGPIQDAGHDEDPGTVADAAGQANAEPGDMIIEDPDQGIIEEDPRLQYILLATVDEDPDNDMGNEDSDMQDTPLVIPNGAADRPRKPRAPPRVEVPLLHFLWSPQGTGDSRR